MDIDTIVMIAGVILGCLIGYSAGVGTTNKFMQEQAIEAGVGEYNSETGLFQYKQIESK